MKERYGYTKTTGREEAFPAAKLRITPQLLEKFKVNAEIDYDDDTYKILGEGKGFNIIISFDENDVELELRLSFFLKPLSKTIMKMLEKEILRVI